MRFSLNLWKLNPDSSNPNIEIEIQDLLAKFQLKTLQYISPEIKSFKYYPLSIFKGFFFRKKLNIFLKYDPTPPYLRNFMQKNEHIPQTPVPQVFKEFSSNKKQLKYKPPHLRNFASINFKIYFINMTTSPMSKKFFSGNKSNISFRIRPPTQYLRIFSRKKTRTYSWNTTPPVFSNTTLPVLKDMFYTGKIESFLTYDPP